MHRNGRQKRRHHPITARPIEERLLQQSKWLWHRLKRRAIAQRTGLSIDQVNVVLPVVMGLIPFKCSGMTGDDFAIGNNRNVRWLDVNADDPMGMFSGYAVAIALQMNQAG